MKNMTKILVTLVVVLLYSSSCVFAVSDEMLGKLNTYLEARATAVQRAVEWQEYIDVGSNDYQLARREYQEAALNSRYGDQRLNY